MHEFDEPNQELNNPAEIRTIISKIYPHIAFDPERVRTKPDEQTFELYSSLRKLDQKESWEQMVKDRLGKGLPLVFDYMDFSNLDLHGLDLSGISFAGANLEGTNLSNCRLDNARFMFANLENANLNGSHARDALFIHTILRNASINHASMGGVYFFSDFSKANVQGSIINPQGFYSIKTEGATLEGLNPDWTKPAIKWEIDPVPDEDLNPEDKEILKKVDAQIERDKLLLKQKEQRKLDEETRELYAELKRLGSIKKTKSYDYQTAQQKLEWLYKKNASGREFDFDGLDLSNLDLSFLDLTHISFVGTNFEGSDITWTNLSGVNCNLANFKDSTIIFSTLRGSTFFGADFTDADLTASRMRDTLHARVNFTNVKFDFTDFKNAVFMGTELLGAQIQDSDFVTASNLNKKQVPTEKGPNFP